MCLCHEEHWGDDVLDGTQERGIFRNLDVEICGAPFKAFAAIGASELLQAIKLGAQRITVATKGQAEEVGVCSVNMEAKLKVSSTRSRGQLQRNLGVRSIVQSHLPVSAGAIIGVQRHRSPDFDRHTRRS